MGKAGGSAVPNRRGLGLSVRTNGTLVSRVIRRPRCRVRHPRPILTVRNRSAMASLASFALNGSEQPGQLGGPRSGGGFNARGARGAKGALAPDGEGRGFGGAEPTGPWIIREDKRDACLAGNPASPMQRAASPADHDGTEPFGDGVVCVVCVEGPDSPTGLARGGLGSRGTGASRLQTA